MQSRPRVLFLYHGGTIGMRVEHTSTGSFVNRVPYDAAEFQETTERLLSGFVERFEIVYRHVTNKDSSNVNPKDWTVLAEMIHAAQGEGFSAVAIGHGTDSLQYTATALSLALHGSNPAASALTIPVVITGAQNSIYLKGGDGEFNLVNLFRTVEAAVQARVADVLVSFWDAVLLGCRAVKVSERLFRAFESPACAPAGVVNAFGVELNLSQVRLAHTGQLASASRFAPEFADTGVMTLEVEPGFDVAGFRALLDTGRFRAIILKTMGDGNIPTEGERSLLPVIAYASEQLKVPIFLTVKTDGASASGSHYDVGIGALRAGAIPCYDHSASAVAVKVRWLIGNGLCRSIDDFRRAFETSFVGEVTAPAA
jgi:L-asparaginase